MIEHLPSMYRAWGPPYIENKTVRLKKVQARALESLVCYTRNLDLTIWPWGFFFSLSHRIRRSDFGLESHNGPGEKWKP